MLVMTMDQLYEKFGLPDDVIEFIGHAIALCPDSSYRRRPALPTVRRIKLYYQSLTRFAGLKSPYIYPLYGLGELPQARARPLILYHIQVLCAVPFLPQPAATSPSPHLSSSTRCHAADAAVAVRAPSCARCSRQAPRSGAPAMRR